MFFMRGKDEEKISWFTNNGKNYYTIVSCPKHGALKGKIRLRKAIKSSKIYVVKTMRLAPPDVVCDIVNKKSRFVKAEKKNGKSHKRKTLPNVFLFFYWNCTAFSALHFFSPAISRRGFPFYAVCGVYCSDPSEKNCSC